MPQHSAMIVSEAPTSQARALPHGHCAKKTSENLQQDPNPFVGENFVSRLSLQLPENFTAAGVFNNFVENLVEILRAIVLRVEVSSG